MSFLERLRMISLGQVGLPCFEQSFVVNIFLFLCSQVFCIVLLCSESSNVYYSKLRFFKQKMFNYITEDVPWHWFNIESDCDDLYNAQGQGPIAETMIASGREGGEWVYLQVTWGSCPPNPPTPPHLAPPRLLVTTTLSDRYLFPQSINCLKQKGETGMCNSQTDVRGFAELSSCIIVDARVREGREKWFLSVDFLSYSVLDLWDIIRS